MAVRRPRDLEPTIALFEPLRLVRAACDRWPSLSAEQLLGLMPPDALSGEPDSQVPLRQVFGILEQIARAVRRSDLPLLLARATRVDEMGVPGFAIMTAGSGREAIARAIRFQGLISASSRWELGESGDGTRLRWLRALPLDLGHRLANELVLAEVVSNARDLLGSFAPLQVAFRHAAPADTRAHRAFFACPVHFGASFDELVLPNAVLERVPVSANEALSRYFHEVAEKQSGEVATPSVSTQVRSWLERALLDGEPDPVLAARRLGMSLRTLQTRLREEGTTFRDALDDLRRERAVVLLNQGESVTGAAFALGFSETSAFSRAFRRWYGRSPRTSLANAG